MIYQNKKTNNDNNKKRKDKEGEKNPVLLYESLVSALKEAC